VAARTSRRAKIHRDEGRMSRFEFHLVNDSVASSITNGSNCRGTSLGSSSGSDSVSRWISHSAAPSRKIAPPNCRVGAVVLFEESEGRVVSLRNPIREPSSGRTCRYSRARPEGTDSPLVVRGRATPPHLRSKGRDEPPSRGRPFGSTPPSKRTSSCRHSGCAAKLVAAIVSRPVIRGCSVIGEGGTNETHGVRTAYVATHCL